MVIPVDIVVPDEVYTIAPAIQLMDISILTPIPFCSNACIYVKNRSGRIVWTDPSTNFAHPSGTVVIDLIAPGMSCDVIGLTFSNVNRIAPHQSEVEENLIPINCLEK